MNLNIQQDGDTISIIPYDRELTLKYVVKCIRHVLDTVEDFVLIMPNGYYADGLSETNNLLIGHGTTIYNKYTQEILTL